MLGAASGAVYSQIVADLNRRDFMGKFGDAALHAAKMMQKRSIDAREAWQFAMRRYFPDWPSAQTKSCPKGAFLGLVELGLRGIKTVKTNAGTSGGVRR